MLLYTTCGYLVFICCCLFVNCEETNKNDEFANEKDVCKSKSEQCNFIPDETDNDNMEETFIDYSLNKYEQDDPELIRILK